MSKLLIALTSDPEHGPLERSMWKCMLVLLQQDGRQTRESLLGHLAWHIQTRKPVSHKAEGSTPKGDLSPPP